MPWRPSRPWPSAQLNQSDAANVTPSAACHRQSCSVEQNSEATLTNRLTAKTSCLAVLPAVQEKRSVKPFHSAKPECPSITVTSSLETFFGPLQGQRIAEQHIVAWPDDQNQAHVNNKGKDGNASATSKATCTPANGTSLGYSRSRDRRFIGQSDTQTSLEKVARMLRSVGTKMRTASGIRSHTSMSNELQVRGQTPPPSPPPSVCSFSSRLDECVSTPFSSPPTIAAALSRQKSLLDPEKCVVQFGESSATDHTEGKRWMFGGANKRTISRSSSERISSGQRNGYLLPRSPLSRRKYSGLLTSAFWDKHGQLTCVTNLESSPNTFPGKNGERRPTTHRTNGKADTCSSACKAAEKDYDRNTEKGCADPDENFVEISGGWCLVDADINNPEDSKWLSKYRFDRRIFLGRRRHLAVQSHVDKDRTAAKQFTHTAGVLFSSSPLALGLAVQHINAKAQLQAALVELDRRLASRCMT